MEAQRVNPVQEKRFSWDRFGIEKLRRVFHGAAFISICVFFTGIYAEFKPKTPNHKGQSILGVFLLMVLAMAYYYSRTKMQKFSVKYINFLSLDKQVVYRCVKLGVIVTLYAIGIEKYPYLFSVCSSSFSGFSLAVLKFRGANFDNFSLCNDFIVALFAPFCDNLGKIILYLIFNASVVKKYVPCTMFDTYGDRYIFAGIFFLAFVFAVFTRNAPELNLSPTEELMEGGGLIDEANMKIQSLSLEIDSLETQRTAIKEEIQSFETQRSAIKEEIQSLKETGDDINENIKFLEVSRVATKKDIDYLKKRRDSLVEYLEGRRKSVVETYEEAKKQIDAITDSLLEIASSSEVVNNNPEPPVVEVPNANDQMRQALVLLSSSSVRSVMDAWTGINTES